MDSPWGASKFSCQFHFNWTLLQTALGLRESLMKPFHTLSQSSSKTPVSPTCEKYSHQKVDRSCWRARVCLKEMGLLLWGDSKKVSLARHYPFSRSRKAAKMVLRLIICYWNLRLKLLSFTLFMQRHISYMCPEGNVGVHLRTVASWNSGRTDL